MTLCFCQYQIILLKCALSNKGQSFNIAITCKIWIIMIYKNCILYLSNLADLLIVKTPTGSISTLTSEVTCGSWKTQRSFSRFALSLMSPLVSMYEVLLKILLIREMFLSYTLQRAVQPHQRTRMHSSRMRTGRSLTVCCSPLPGGGGLPVPGGRSAWSQGGFSLVTGEGSACSGGVCLVRGGSPETPLCTESQTRVKT